MFVRIIQFSVLPEFVPELTDHFHAMIESILKPQPGFAGSRVMINYTTYQCLTVTSWLSKDALDLSEANGYLSNIFNNIKPMLASRPLISYYQDVI